MAPFSDGSVVKLVTIVDPLSGTSRVVYMRCFQDGHMIQVDEDY